jgi:hypothetical protein
MIDREIDISTKDGVMNTFITHPEEGDAHPLVWRETPIRWCCS